MKGIIIQGSSRSNGNTHKVVEILREKTGMDVLDLRDKNIAPFDYDFNNQDDDFLPIIRNIADNYDTIIFATPVYWYSMSGIMKNFFDRISDCLKIEKDTGRKLRGKSMGLLICGYDDTEFEGFDMPFRNSAQYLGMNYLGYVHTWVEDGKPVDMAIRQKLHNFADELAVGDWKLEAGS